jgi:hypothetical protein
MLIGNPSHHDITKIEEKQCHFTSYVENSPKAIDFYIESQKILLIP